MSQIKPTQIIPGRQVRPNPITGFPVDLSPAQRSLLAVQAEPANRDFGSEGQLVGPDTSGFTIGTVGTESVLQQEDPTPSTPAILSVKEQIVKFMPDGTAKIDVILEVQDIAGAVEYDIRVAKNAGDL